MPSGELYRSSVWKFTPSLGSETDSSNHMSSPPKEAKRKPSSSDGGVTAGQCAGGSSSPVSTTSREDLLPFHKFRTGDSVLITRFDQQHQKASTAMPLSYEGAVLEMRKGHLLVTLEAEDAEQMQAAVKNGRVGSEQIETLLRPILHESHHTSSYFLILPGDCNVEA